MWMSPVAPVHLFSTSTRLESVRTFTDTSERSPSGIRSIIAECVSICAVAGPGVLRHQWLWSGRGLGLACWSDSLAVTSLCGIICRGQWRILSSLSNRLYMNVNYLLLKESFIIFNTFPSSEHIYVYIKMYSGCICHKLKADFCCGHCLVFTSCFILYSLTSCSGTDCFTVRTRLLFLAAMVSTDELIMCA